jgi:complement component 1 Q subcomponent-binding protein
MSFRIANRVLAQALKQSVSVRTASQLPKLAVSSRAFSTSRAVLNEPTQRVGSTLKLELEHENENAPEPFTETSFAGFKVVNTDGQALAKLEKDSSDELVHVFFDVNQVVNLRSNEAEELEEQEEGFEDPYDSNFINVNVVVEKKTDGSAVAFDVLVGPEDGSSYIENITTYADKSEALVETAEAEQKRELSYNGPAFTNLDEKLQEDFENYLVSRGINTDLFRFIVDYGVAKENQEYVSWLSKLNKFFN